MTMRYQDVVVELTGESVEDAGRRVGRYRARVLQSPAGELTADQALSVEFGEKDLQRSLDKLEARELNRDELIALGRTLAALLLPVAPDPAVPSVRELFARSLAQLPADTGLRLRLRLPRELSVIPWEYAYVERAGGEGMDGFLALDPRIAIVRHEQLTLATGAPRAAGELRLVAALASAPDLPELDLETELQDLQAAVADIAGLDVAAVEHATLAALQPVLPGADIFHFAGHGDFTKEMGARPGTYVGTGVLAFEDQRVAAEQFALNLRGHGVQLAVLGGCRTGRRDGFSVWSGIAPALVKAEIPAVLANQYSIADKSAIAFSRAFYLAIAGGAPIERAVTAGRIAAYNGDPNGRDWGVPVLYLRAADGELFAGVGDPAERASALEQAEAGVRVRAEEVAAGGVLHGAEVGELLSGRLAVEVTVGGTVAGEVVGAKFDSIDAGSADVRVETRKVERGGSVIGAQLGKLGEKFAGLGRTMRAAPAPAPSPPAETAARISNRAAPPSPAPPTRAMPEATAAAPPAAAEPAAAGAEPSGEPASLGAPPAGAGAEPALARSTTRVSVSTGEVHGGEVIGTQYNDSHEIHQISAETVNIYQGPVATTVEEPELVEERIRLDVAVPKSAQVEQPFKVFVAVKQPGAPPLQAGELDRVVGQEGVLYREEDDQVVRYRVEVTGDGFRVAPPHYVFRLRPGKDSPVIGFQVVASRAGKQSLFVNAYQEEGAVPELIAQTILEIEVEIAITNT